MFPVPTDKFLFLIKTIFYMIISMKSYLMIIDMNTFSNKKSIIRLKRIKK